MELDGERVYEKRAQKLAPAEMETVTLKAQLIEKANGKTLLFKIEDIGEKQ